MNNKKHYLIKTYGCQMNVHESEKLAGMMKSLGYEETAIIDNADIVVFNTCCIRDGAEQKIYAHIGALKNLKKVKKDLIVAVCGCLTQADGRAEEIKRKFPFVNILIGTHNIHLFKEYLETYLKNKKFISDIWDKEKEINENVDMFRTSGKNAWVNISYGCNNFCSYCIVPYVRGRERSRDINEILSEIKCLAKQGYKYITLLGQNVNSYGNDLADENINFVNLLRNASKIEGDFIIKFMTSHPKDLTEEVINEIASNEKLAKVIHLPVQSGNNRILNLMNRRYTREKYLSLIKLIKERIPNAILTTDIIVGFPSETEEEFMDTFNLVKEVRYDSIFAFMYSKRSNTPAEKMENQIPLDIKRDRVNRLLALSKLITKEINKSLIGKEYNTTLDYIEGEIAYFETDSGKTIIVENANIEIDKSKFYTIKIIAEKNNKLYGEITNYVR